MDIVEGEPDQWKELRNPTALTTAISVKDVITGIRHALAHGNLYTRPSGTNTQIKHIIFLAGKGTSNEPYRYVQVSPQDFRTFLLNWFTFVKNLDMPDSFVAESDMAA